MEKAFSDFSAGLPWQFISHDALANIYYNYDKVSSISEWILNKIKENLGDDFRPAILVICGSGLGGLAEVVEKRFVLPYADIPEFPKSTVEGHKGNLIFGQISGLNVVCMQGRFHPFEGYPMAVCTLPIKVCKLLGIKAVVLTNAAGGLNPSYNVGDLMLIKDHVSVPLLALQHPLIGPNDKRFGGPRFTPVNNIYNLAWRDLFKQCAKELSMEIQEGVYSSVGGPSYETVTDSKFLLQIGADTVGMSSSHEATVAAYLGLKLVGFSIVTDKVSLEYDEELYSNHDEIVQVANKKARECEKLVILFLAKLAQNPSLLE